MSEPGPPGRSASFARGLLRRCGRAALATSRLGAPYASLVLVAADLDGGPLLLLSDLAQHSRNIAFDPRVSLLLDATEGRPDPLAGPRLTVLGQAKAVADRRRLARFAARHPSAASYAGFADFRLYRVAVERGHLVAGFGRIEWIEAAALLSASDTSALAAAEPALLAQINHDHAAAIARCAHNLLGRAGTGWRLTGIDPDGIDLRRADETGRIEFAAPLYTPDEVLDAFAGFVQRARR